jgi:hydroxymethylglutaryl-CoA reductase
MPKTSDLTGFYKLNPSERLNLVKEFANLTDDEARALGSTGALPMEQANRRFLKYYHA